MEKAPRDKFDYGNDTENRFVFVRKSNENSSVLFSEKSGSIDPIGGQENHSITMDRNGRMDRISTRSVLPSTQRSGGGPVLPVAWICAFSMPGNLQRLTQEALNKTNNFPAICCMIGGTFITCGPPSLFSNMFSRFCCISAPGSCINLLRQAGGATSLTRDDPAKLCLLWREGRTRMWRVQL